MKPGRASKNPSMLTIFELEMDWKTRMANYELFILFFSKTIRFPPEFLTFTYLRTISLYKMRFSGH